MAILTAISRGSWNFEVFVQDNCRGIFLSHLLIQIHHIFFPSFCATHLREKANHFNGLDQKKPILQWGENSIQSKRTVWKKHVPGISLGEYIPFLRYCCTNSYILSKHCFLLIHFLICSHNQRNIPIPQNSYPYLRNWDF